MTDEQKQQVRERIGGRVATLRKLNGMTQEQLAQAAGLQRTHVNRIEAGKYDVTICVLQAIAESLGMTVDMIDPALQDLTRLKRM
jgi:transcriptional regulator with XRE-family HTH domain